MSCPFEYASVTELKNQIQQTSAADDALLLAILQSASRAIDRFCNREQDGFRALTATSVRLYSGRGAPTLRINECVAITLVEVKESSTSSTYTAWASTDWLAATGDPERPNFNRLPYDLLLVDPTGSYSYFTTGRYGARRGFRPIDNGGSRGVPTVRVTARWGYSDDNPPAIKQATLITAARWYKRGQSAWSDTLASSEIGQLMYTQELDPAVKAILVGGRYIRPAVG